MAENKSSLMAGSLMDVFVKIGADTSALEGGIDKAKGLAGGLGSAIGGAMKVAVGAIGAATSAVGAFAASSVKVGQTFDASMSQVAATMGVTTDEIGELRDFAMEMGATTAFSATEAADALNYMALAGYDADTSMKMLPNVLNLAAAGGIGLAQASDMVTDAQTALGLSLEQTTELVDMMAKTSSKSNTSVQQLGDAILTIGGTAKNLAGGTNELNTMLGVLADNGIKGSEAGTHLRNAILSLSAPTDNAAKALESLGVNAVDATTGNLRPLNEIMGDLSEALDGLGGAEKADIISTIFNKTDIAAVNAMLDTTADRYDELSAAIDGAWYSESSLKKQFESVGLSMEESQATLQKLGVSQEEYERALSKSKGSASVFANELAHYAKEGTSANDVLSAMGTSLADLQTAFNDTQGAAEQMANTQLENLSGSLTKWSSALEGVKLLISGELAPELKEFVDFGTEGLSKISEAFKEGGMSGAMEAFRGILSDGIGMITEKIPDAIDAGMELLGAVGQGLLDNIPTIVDAAVKIVAQFAKGLIEAVPELTKGTFTLIDSLKKAFSDNSELLINTGIDILKMISDGILNGIPAVITAIIDIINSMVDFIKNNGTQMIGAGLDLITSLVEGLMSAIPQLISAAAELIVQLALMITDPGNLAKLVVIAGDLVMALANGILEAIPKLLDAIPQIISNLVGAIVASLPEILAVGVQLLLALISGIIQTIPRLVLAIPSIITALVGGLVQGIQSIVEVGKNMVEGLWEGIKGRWDALVQDFKDLASGLVDGIKGLFGIHSPSKVFAEMGRYIDEGLAQGINAYSDVVDNAMSNITDIPDINSEANINANSKAGFGGIGGSFVINVYGTQGMDEMKLARLVADEVRDQVVSIGAMA